MGFQVGGAAPVPAVGEGRCRRSESTGRRLWPWCELPHRCLPPLCPLAYTLLAADAARSAARDTLTPKPQRQRWCSRDCRPEEADGCVLAAFLLLPPSHYLSLWQFSGHFWLTFGRIRWQSWTAARIVSSSSSSSTRCCRNSGGSAVPPSTAAPRRPRPLPLLPSRRDRDSGLSRRFLPRRAVLLLVGLLGVWAPILWLRWPIQACWLRLRPLWAVN